MSWNSDHGWKSADSRAVVFWNGKHGMVLFWVGGDLDCEIRDSGIDLEDLGLQGSWAGACKAPLGMSIWEGRYITRRVDDEVSTPDGNFRELTEDEWAFVKIGEAPWNPEEWKLK